MFEFITVRELYEMFLSNQMMDLEGYEYVELEGWVRTNRNNGKLGFIALNDGTYFKNLQVVYTEAEISNYEEIDKLSTGSSIRVVGKLKLTPEGKQPFEVEATEIEIEGKCDEDFPLQKKRHSFEYMREIPHLRPRANTFYAIFRLRSVLSMAIHEFFQSQGFVYVHTPIITGNDGEGAGEMFRATTIDNTEFDNDFFGKEANLTVSGQLNAEIMALAFRNVYTFGPTFRAEESKGRRHMTEFWMMEPEMAWMHQDESLDIQERYLAYMVKQVLENNEYELKILGRDPEKLRPTTEGNFTRLSYDDAIKMLQEAGRDIKWGDDFGAPDEGYISEQFDRPVFIVNYPTTIKPFYMKKNPDNPKEYLCADVIAPEGYGEIFGGSEREGNYEILKQQIEEAGLNLEDYQWYLDLRKFGGVPHSGFGMGFERTIAWICKLDHIREAIPFPRLINRMQP